MNDIVDSNPRNTTCCSFCGKSQYEVRKLVAGPRVFICDECVEISMDIVREESSSFYLRTPDEYRKLAEANVRIAEAAGVPRDKALLAVSRTCFFFQAEDGIRDDLVTGVQTCAL